jgi:hypothetical protein
MTSQYRVVGLIRRWHTSLAVTTAAAVLSGQIAQPGYGETSAYGNCQVIKADSPGDRDNRVSSCLMLVLTWIAGGRN